MLSMFRSVIKVKYLGPTSYKPSRFKITYLEGENRGKSKTVSKSYEFNGMDHQMESLGYVFIAELDKNTNIYGKDLFVKPVTTVDTEIKVNTEVKGSRRTITINGQTFTIFPLYEGPSINGTDKWQYTLPNGQTYGHPSEFGALLMCLKFAGGDEWKS
jgi:hypothetical protein